MDTDKLCGKWLEEVEKKLSNNMPQVRDAIERAKNEYNTEVWLGGPGNQSEFYPLRMCVKCVLEKRNFNVRFSEDHDLDVNVAKKESLEARILDLVIILAITPGASAEAMEFAYIPDIKDKLTVYIPRQYNGGYLFKSLHEKHKIITEECLFCMKGFAKGNTELIMTLAINAEFDRCDKFMKEKNREHIKTL